MVDEGPQAVGRRRERDARGDLVDRGPQPRDDRLGVETQQNGIELDDALLDPTRVDDEHDHEVTRAQGHELDVPHGRAGERRVLHHGHLPREAREQAHGAVDDVVEVDGPFEKLADRAFLTLAERFDGTEPVDEHAIAGVGGNPAGRGVRRVDESLLLEQGHVVAHGGGAHPEVVTFDEGLAAHGLGGVDVVLDDRAQHHQPAVLAHLHLPLVWHSLCRSAKSTTFAGQLRPHHGMPPHRLALLPRPAPAPAI